MARRRLLSDEQMATFWAWAIDEREIVRHYTLSAADIELVGKRRVGATRLGFAVLLCVMRFPGRVLDVQETPPAAVLAFIAGQVGVPVAEFATYQQRATNRREHIAELMQVLGCRPFDAEAASDLMAFAVTLAQGMPRLERLIAAVIEEARKRRVLLPSPRAIDLLCQQARVRSERLLYKALTSGASDVTKKSLAGCWIWCRTRP
jgi:TnpA family transposase